MNRIDLTGQVAIVTGGSGGIGLATVDRLAASGAKVLLWDINEASLARAATSRPDIATRRVDMLDAAAVSDAMAATTTTFGRIDILVNCIGMEGTRASVIDYDVAEWRRLLEINLTASFIACKFGGICSTRLED
jgi:NAD(P)-dependent dehydrogenase (short-subunit alcohol dehydrogenase family)